MANPIPQFILNQTTSLDLDPGKPLILVDADEVIVHFALPLRDYLSQFGLELHFHSYKIFDNVTEKESGNILPREQALPYVGRFFDDCIYNQPAVEGAVDALKSLSKTSQIIIVTNVPFKAKEDRQKAMVKLGMNYPVLANEGLKGPIIKHLSKNQTAPVVFLDDISHNIQSVSKYAPHVHCIHFIAEAILRPLQEKAKGAHVRIDQWDECHRYINSHFSELGY